MAIPVPAGGAQRGPRQFGIDIAWPDLPAWLPEEAAAELGKLVHSSLELALQTVAGYVADKAPRDSGGLAQSFGAYPATDAGGISIVGAVTTANLTGRVHSSLPHAIVMNDGRQPGFPVSRAGIDAIGLWAERKLGLSPQEADRVKWAIAGAIVKRGIPGTFYFEKGVTAATPVVQQMFTILAGQIATALFTPTGKQRNVNLGKFIGRIGKGKR